MQNSYCPWPRVDQTLQIINHQWDSRNTERTVGRQGTSLVYLPRGHGTKEKEGQKKRKLIKKGGVGFIEEIHLMTPSKVKSPLCKALEPLWDFYSRKDPGDIAEAMIMAWIWQAREGISLELITPIRRSLVLNARWCPDLDPRRENKEEIDVSEELEKIQINSLVHLIETQ